MPNTGWEENATYPFVRDGSTTQEKIIKPARWANLVDLYYRSVGHNANFLLNFPVALTGKITAADSTRAVEWYQTIQNDLKDNLLKGISLQHLTPAAENTVHLKQQMEIGTPTGLQKTG